MGHRVYQINEGDGRRVRKDVGVSSTLFVYNAQGQLVAEYNGAVSNNGTSYVTADALGSTRIVTGSGQEVKSRHDYLPFGEEIKAQAVASGRTDAQGYRSGDVRQKFTGYERDAETSLDYAKARYYGSGYGRFNSADPYFNSRVALIPQGWNRYAYCLNNPLALIDPSGLTWLQSTKDPKRYIFVADDEYNRDAYPDYNVVENGTIIELTGVTGDYARYSGLIGMQVSLDANGTLSPVIDAGNIATVDVSPSDDNSFPLFGGLNPLYHPLPWRGPNLPNAWPKSGPVLTPTEPPPPPPGFTLKPEIGPGGVRIQPSFDPNYAPPNASTSSRFARVGWKLIEAMMNATNNFGTGTGEVGPIITINPNFILIMQCQGNPACERRVLGGEPEFY